MPSPEFAVVTDGLTKHFGDLVAVDAIDLHVESGTVMSLLGPNGAGKTTTVRMLATLSEPTSGTASVCGHDIVRDADAVRSVISLTGQFAALADNLTSRENLLLMARLRGYSRSAAVRIVDSHIDRFDIGEFRDKLIKAVSGGQRRRVDLAASLVVQPELLVLDEPTTGLDPRSRQVVWATVRDLVDEGVTLLLTTQNLEEADALADEITVIDQGRVIAHDTPHGLKRAVGGQRLTVHPLDPARYGDLVTVLSGITSATGVAGRDQRAEDGRGSVTVRVDGDEVLPEVVARLRAAGIATDEFSLHLPSLDEVFFSLTGTRSGDSRVPEEIVS